MSAQGHTGVTSPAAGSLQWRYLTSLRRKRTLYAVDPYFREGAWDASAILGERFYPLLHETALMVVKPEALAARRLPDIRAYVETAGFRPMAALAFERLEDSKSGARKGRQDRSAHETDFYRPRLASTLTHPKPKTAVPRGICQCRQRWQAAELRSLPERDEIICL